MSTNIYDDAERAERDVVRIVNDIRRQDEHGKTVYNRMTDACNGHPKASRCDTDRVSASGISDPTGNAAMLADRAAQHIKELEQLMSRIARAADKAVDILACYTPRHPTEMERERTAQENEPHCENCATAKPKAGWWQEPHTQYRTTVNDRIDKPLWLCTWCYEHVVTTEGFLPNEDELTAHRDGKRIHCPHPRKQAA